MNPIILILLFVSFGIGSALNKDIKKVLSNSLLFAFIGTTGVLTLTLPVLFGWSGNLADNFWLIDKFSALIASLIGVLYLTASIVSFRYIGHEYEEKIINSSDVRIYFSLISFFVLCMLVTVLTNNVLLMWIALEGTTLSSTFLVGLYRKRASMEAAWKYIIICSTGITLGLVGILLLGYGASLNGVHGLDTFSLSFLMQNAGLISMDIVRWAFTFIFIGFGAKVGLVPMHTWLPDAHSKAPSPISALFSGILLNVALYGIMRFKFITDGALGSSEWSNQLFLFFGFISIIVPAFMMMVQGNYKRMLAYSSVEHMGLITFALSLSPVGIFAAVVHMIGHTFIKSLLFFGAGEILILFKTTKTQKINGLMRKAPRTAVLFLCGILMIIALPPSVLFVSEYGMFVNAFSLHPILSLFVFIALSVIAYSMLKSTLAMFYAEDKEDSTQKETWNITHWVMIGQLIFVASLTFLISSDKGIAFINSIVAYASYVAK